MTKPEKLIEQIKSQIKNPDISEWIEIIIYMVHTNKI